MLQCIKYKKELFFKLGGGKTVNSYCYIVVQSNVSIKVRQLDS